MEKDRKKNLNVPLTRRQKFQVVLESVLGSNQVYFQPPPNVKMEYPCIVYSKAKPVANRADNLLYTMRQRYTVIHISRDADDVTPNLIAMTVPLCSIDRYYIADNLYHTVFDIYY